MPNAPINQAVRLDLIHQRCQFSALRHGHAHWRVKPQHADFTILGQKLAHLGQTNLLKIAFKSPGIVIMISTIAAMMPILRLGVIQAKDQTLFTTSIGKLSHKITPTWTCFEAVKVRNLCIKQRETVMMLSGEAQVAHAPGFGFLGNRSCVKVYGVKLLRQKSIVIHRNVQVILNPLCQAGGLSSLPLTTQKRIQTKVNKQTIFHLSELFKRV